MSKNEILTTTLPTGETVLAKRDTNTEDGYDYECLTPLRYGNETAAQRKLDSILPLLSPVRSAGIVKQEGRFLIFVCDSPGYQTISHDDAERMMLSRMNQTPETVRTIVIDTKSPEYLDKPIRFSKMMSDPKLASMAPFIRKRYVFATISGYRMNPRSRHNHPTNTTDERYYYVS